MSTQEQIAPAIDRSTFIGGSDMAAILGLSPWRTPYQVWREKTGEDDARPDPAKSRILRRGQLLEPVIVQLAKEEYDIEVVSRNQRFADKELPFLSCEIDLEWLDLDGIQNADAKSVNAFAANDWGKEQGGDDIPLYYTVQFLHGLGITGRQRTLVLALIGTDDLRVYRVERDDEMIAHLRVKAQEFWHMVQTRKAPPVKTLDDIRIAYPKDSGRILEATPDIVKLISEHKVEKGKIAEAAKRCEGLELDIFRFMADATQLVGSDGKVIATRKLQERASYTVAPTSYRVFRAK